MTRYVLPVLLTLTFSSITSAQTFDHYLNKILTNIDKQKGVKEIKKLTSEMITDYDRVDAKANAAFIVVRTNQGRSCKLLVQSARQKISDEKSIPILYVKRFVTYRIGTEEARIAEGGKLSLFPGFRLSLDLGQVVPEEVAADLKFVVDGENVYTEPVGKAKLYLLTEPVASVKPRKGDKVVVGEKFELEYFNGQYQLYDDGRRSGKLKIYVDGTNGKVEGAYYSDRDGRKYEVEGKVGDPQHAIRFSIKLPQAQQVFDGYLFTGDAKVIAGTSRLVKRQAGFYAVRIEE